MQNRKGEVSQREVMADLMRQRGKCKKGQNGEERTWSKEEDGNMSYAKN